MTRRGSMFFMATVLLNATLADPLHALQLPTPVPTPAARPDACADPDGDGEVTVTDGVAALRAAADLSSDCSDISCDVDGSGAVTLSDGIAILQRAAGLAAAYACPVPSEHNDFSQFASFRLSRAPTIGFCLPAGSVFSAAIDGGAGSVYRLRASVVEERPADDPACSTNPFVDDGHCLVPVDIPGRILSPAEVAQLREAFASVAILVARDPFCAFGSIDPCRYDSFDWDGFALSDFACTAPRLPYGEVLRLTQTLEDLLRP